MWVPRAYQGLLREPFLFGGTLMKRAAVFVDAGYLFAQGSVALTGSKQPRSLLEIDELAVLAEFAEVAKARAKECEILRNYWYDGASFKGPTIEQDRLAHLDNIKLRLGLLNSAGEQKGVDSLIVTDLIELARLGAICDAILLSGDEDVRVGVQIAQNYGVRLHLVGIAPSRGSQSKALLQEADTTTVWDKDLVAKFLKVRPSVSSKASLGPASAKSAPIVVKTTSAETNSGGADATLSKVAHDLVDGLDQGGLAGVHAFWTTDRGVPPEFDGKLLGKCRDELGRDLSLLERRTARTAFSTAVKSKS
jgi:uncharacterized LabA/DUF88 family protein